ncbi:bile acid:sodium symporter family protein [Sphingomonas cavernae]|uniref:Bile acid:sodium symporter family protein n=1 Tax=Sphingomonas cavernae TaxID=2320861 RepID=A0A418WUM3_9SPHN|nr:bile acid:sodium symporter [Sphingomonas cavernae]RJF96404.1 bile acid:sodium symporter family protein [Sphingomonas cavernae]
MAGIFPFLSQTVFPIIIFAIMFGMGLALGADDFRAILARPRAVIVGLSAQMLLLPLIALGLAFALPIAPEVAVGLIILAASPGGVTSNAITLAARADVALAVSLTALSTLFVAFTLPLWTHFALDQFLGSTREVGMPLGQTAITLGALTILPVALGMGVRARWPEMAARGVEAARPISVLGIVFMCLSTTAFNWHHLAGWRVFGESFGICLALMLLAMMGAWLLATIARLPAIQTLTIVIEVGVHNLAIALLASVTLVEMPAIARLPLAYGLLMISVPWLYIRWERRRQARGAAAMPSPEVAA